MPREKGENKKEKEKKQKKVTGGASIVHFEKKGAFLERILREFPSVEETRAVSK